MTLTPYEAPCKGCTDRCAEPNCHTDCSRYLAFRAAVDAEASKKLVKAGLNAYTFDRISRSRDAARRTWKQYRNQME